jgi:hypothetical protein
VAAEHSALRYQNDKLMQYQIGKKGPQKNLGLTAIFVLFLSLAFGFFLSFCHSSCACSPKALHDQQYHLETLRDWIFVNKTYKYCTKGPAWSAIQIRNTKRLNFCEQNLQETDQFKIGWRSGNFSGGCCLAESRYQTSLNFIQMITVTQWLVQ